ncbi:MAG: inositol monophosphatase [Nanoarchaeota archaeon]|nr:inositol monophosphatase [Nanoarchaeota archaeon]
MKEFIIGLAEEAGKLQLRHFQDHVVSYKSHKDLVTTADIAVEKFIKEKIVSRYPDHSIISEESDKLEKHSRFTWVIDPIDGTANFAHNYPQFCVSIALMEHSEIKFGTVYMPFYEEMFYAEKGKGAYLNNERIFVTERTEPDKSMMWYLSGIDSADLDMRLNLQKVFIQSFERVRGIGALALETCYVAAGRGEGVMRFSDGAKIWDYAAASLILEEAGGKVTDLENKKISFREMKSDFLATNGRIHENLLRVINKSMKER